MLRAECAPRVVNHDLDPRGPARRPGRRPQPVSRLGLRRPKQAIGGVDVAGIVEAVGRDVTELRAGDEVFGARSGAYAEYVAGRVRNFVPKPASLSCEQAAAIAVAAITALQALRDQGQVQPGQRVLIIGAGGGVGSFSVELAKAFGATVTAATSTSNLELVRSIGADEVVDYTRTDVTRSGHQFDVVLDVGGYRSPVPVSYTHLTLPTNREG